MSLLEIIAVIISFLTIWLTARRSMLCWPLGLIACACYFKLFHDVRLYADMTLQLLFGLSMVYGWIAWRRGADAEGAVTVNRLSIVTAAIGLGLGAAGSLAIGWLTSRYTDAALPWVDSALSSFSLVAQYWTARRYTANWLLWIAVDIIYVGMFLFKGLWLTAGLYAAMTVLAVIGYQRWLEVVSRAGRDGR
ncbi:nicotinamide riboside transporter PnuC [Sphingomonas abietis]|uniref:Nicotinamide riboside transporter PnuC n=1 Tax=Sphingomonas abietis TaxID=3012344 RepID=A0ABY7NL71_9SPHN|nr:nicotinamide riboside transporter PnuC [Sphingomonas abietis]WBO21555.1 nicotinamide riboside transporter PnuC [Sphingomonas abietis]